MKGRRTVTRLGPQLDIYIPKGLAASVPSSDGRDSEHRATALLLLTPTLQTFANNLKGQEEKPEPGHPNSLLFLLSVPDRTLVTQAHWSVPDRALVTQAHWPYLGPAEKGINARGELSLIFSGSKRKGS